MQLPVDIIVGADDVKTEKPNPEGLLSVIEDLGAMKEEVLYVGDSLVDAKTAENAKVKAKIFQMSMNMF